jgi:prepilin-type N-terminal cleavage/methylation domain-containing protein
MQDTLYLKATMRPLTDSSKGFSLIELLITMGILAIILGGLVSVFSSTNKTYSTQNEMINVQENARSTLDFIVRPLRNATASSVTITGTSPNQTVSFSVIEDFSRSTGGNSTTTLIDSTKSWTSNQWSNYYVYINSGTGAMSTDSQKKQISSNTSSQLTISSAWSTTPDSTSDYKILSTHSFSISGTNLQYSKNGTTTTLSTNITGLTASKTGTDPLSRVDLTLSAQTANARQDTGQTLSVTVNSSVKLNN